MDYILRRPKMHVIGFRNPNKMAAPAHRDRKTKRELRVSLALIPNRDIGSFVASSSIGYALYPHRRYIASKNAYWGFAGGQSLLNSRKVVHNSGKWNTTF